MADFDSIVQLNITTNTATVSQIGFGMPLVLSASATWPEWIRYYTSLLGVAADFAPGTAEYGSAVKLFSQKPRPPKIAIGRLAHPPTMVWTLTPVTTNNTTYGFTFDGHHVSVNYVDSTPTAAELVALLKTAFDALALPVTSSGSGTLILTSNVAGAWHQLVSDDITKLGVAQTNTDPGSTTGIAADMAQILSVAADWYCVTNPYASSSIIAALAAWIEANEKTLLQSTQDSVCATTAPGGSDIMATLKTSLYDRTMLAYHPDNGAFLAEAWAGAKLPSQPGSETWKFASLQGVPSVAMTPTQQSNVLGKNGNIYTTVGGRGMTSEGWTSGGEFFDTTRGVDWQGIQIQQEIVSLLTGGRKIPQTDEGVAQVAGAVRVALARGVSVGFLKPDPKPVVTFPKVADISTSNLSNRILPDGAFQAFIAGAWHKVILSGTISVGS